MDTFWIVPLLHASSDILSAIHQRFKTAVWKGESEKTTVPAKHTDIDNKLTAATNKGRWLNCNTSTLLHACILCDF